ncbi:Uncharacterized protein dnm_061590 [Desulfonema magnum]|uniref:Uncharacterized protein n=1 Tax=Desulfonema magnum TaxID=45655 RepID=A0A975BR62_9BACT|nr:Uncharacterized protein dnm_061590 [Desulfonema magnum]
MLRLKTYDKHWKLILQENSKKFKIGKMTFYKYKFDFEVGTLVKSPCRKCDKRKDFPACTEDCKMLDKIQSVLAETRSCSKDTWPSM